MKKIVFTLLLLFSLTGFLSAQQSKMTGFGKFKLGMTRAEVSDIIDDTTQEYDPYEQFKDDPILGKVTGLKTYECFPVNGIKMRNAEFLFLDDALYSISCAGGTIIAALSLKYGEPKLLEKEQEKI